MYTASWDNPALLADLRGRTPAKETPLQVLQRINHDAQALVEEASNAGQDLSFESALRFKFEKELEKYGY